ncbi:MAG: merTP [Bryobacterales bacterium]|nr:merTP [Bryobacterales bacterium]
MLSNLEKKRTGQEAWLDHPGTTLAIVWKNGSKADVRTAEIQSVADDRGISLHELTGDRRDETLELFASRNGWYRGAEVDRPSEEEAGVIVERIVPRSILKEPTISGKAESLKTALTKVIREQLIGCTSTQCREDCHKKLVDIAHQNLNDCEFRALMEAEKQGDRPVGDEQ